MLKEKCRKLKILVYKNFLIRKNYWLSSLLQQILIPLFLIWWVSSMIESKMITISEGNNEEVSTKNLMNNEYNLTKNFENNKMLKMEKKQIISVDEIVSIAWLKHLMIVSDNKFTEDFVHSIKNCIGIEDDDIKKYKTEKDLLDAYDLTNTNQLGLVFYDFNNSMSHLKYKIHVSDVQIPLNPYELKSEPKEPITTFILSGLLGLQLCVDKCYIEMLINRPLNTNFSMQLAPLQSTPRSNDQDYYTWKIGLFLIMNLVFFCELCYETIRSSEEKFLGVNVLMAMNGVPNYMHLLSWLISGLLFSLCYIVPITYRLRVVHSNLLLFWLVHTLHAAHLYAFGMHFAAYFQKSKHLNSAVIGICVATEVLNSKVLEKDYSYSVPYYGLIFPKTLTQYIWDDFVYRKFVSKEEPNLSNLFNVNEPKHGKAGSLGALMIIFICGTILHLTLANYIYAINPGRYGAKKRPLYFLEYFRKSNTSNNYDDLTDRKKASTEPTLFEKFTNYTPGIQIRNLEKYYNVNFGKVHALKGITIDFYRGQITSLLGHNGAGKTTMMSILTGMISPSDGLVLVNGKNINDSMDEIMLDMGLCPQENIVFPNLTVYQQFKFFAMLKSKNKSTSIVKNNIDSLLHTLKLYDKRNTYPTNLSGGQKRRVCLGMALVGDSNILILDEPTSGLDPETRREIWDMLLKSREKKTILISTHDMEEADVLGDVIAIVHSGKLKSYGTSLFLKKMLGGGNVEVTLSLEPGTDLVPIQAILGADSQVSSRDNTKIVLSVPLTSKLPDALDRLESKKSDLGIRGMSVSLITLEQVFIKVSKDDDEIVEKESVVNITRGHKSRKRTLLAMKGLFVKKAKFALNNASTPFIILLMILLNLIFIYPFYNETRFFKDNKLSSIKFHLNVYNEAKTIYKTSNQNNMYGIACENVMREYGGYAFNYSEKADLYDALEQYRIENYEDYLFKVISATEFNTTGGGLHVKFMPNINFISYSMPIAVNLMSNILLRALKGPNHSIQAEGQNFQLVDVAVLQGYGTEIQLRFILSIFFLVLCLTTEASLMVLQPMGEAETNIRQLQKMTGLSTFTYWGATFLFDLVLMLIATGLMVIGFVVVDQICGTGVMGVSEIAILTGILLLFFVGALLLMYSFTCMKYFKTSTALAAFFSIGPQLLIFAEALLTFFYKNKTLKILEAIRPLQKLTFLLMPYVSLYHGLYGFFDKSLYSAGCRSLSNYFSSPLLCQFSAGLCCKMKCSLGKCQEPVRYFDDFDEDVSLGVAMIYLCLSPFLYCVILWIVDNKLIQILLARFTHKTHDLDVVYEEEVMKERQRVANEIEVIRNKSGTVGTTSVANTNIDVESQNTISTGGVRYVDTDSEYPNSTTATSVTYTESDYPSSTEMPTAKNTKVENIYQGRYVFLVYELRKRYGKFLAVKDVSFGVHLSECFGLLGVNGAGKSTTFRMMTAEELPDCGAIFLSDREISKNTDCKQMGYCPQNDAIIPSLNSYEHLRLFARLRGIPDDEVNNEVTLWIQRLNLGACAAQASDTYSGGNKRRLNIAMAMIGTPRIILMDEPTTGVDPANRRSLWAIIKSCQRSAGQAFVLTSHSMEECEALCGRLAIMVAGKFVCIGSSEELKQQFGAGYDIKVKLNPVQARDEVEAIKEFIQTSLQCELVDEHSTYMMYHVPSMETNWRQMYDVMNEAKENFSSIEDYYVMTATLERLFLSFARSENAPS